MPSESLKVLTGGWSIVGITRHHGPHHRLMTATPDSLPRWGRCVGTDITFAALTRRAEDVRLSPKLGERGGGGAEDAFGWIRRGTVP